MTPAHRDIFDIDDTFNAAYGGQQMTLWNAHQDERGFASMHVYHAGTGLPVATILRPAKTPNGREVRTVIKHLTKRILKTWRRANIVWRGDSHYGRAEAMDWCDANGVGYIFGFAGNSVLEAQVAEAADHLRFWHTWSSLPKMRCYKSLDYQAGSWSTPRRVIARIEASLHPDPTPADPNAMRQEIDVRYVATSLDGDAERLNEGVYCQRGQAENLIKLHKAKLASNRTSCHSAAANQVRLTLHTAAFWLMHTVRAAISQGHSLAKAEFNTIRLRLLKIAARVIEHGRRIRVHLPSSCVEKPLFRAIALGLSPSRWRVGHDCPAATAERGKPTPQRVAQRVAHDGPFGPNDGARRSGQPARFCPWCMIRASDPARLLPEPHLRRGVEWFMRFPWMRMSIILDDASQN